MNIKIEFGKHLRKIRKEHNLTQEKLAELTGMDRSYISDIERGVKNISIEKLYQIAKALKIELSELVKIKIDKRGKI